MAHPYSIFPDICKEDTGNFDTPTTSIQDDGWPDASVPAAKHFNWFAHWTSKWTNYLASIVPDDLLAQLAGTDANITLLLFYISNLYSKGVEPKEYTTTDTYLKSSDGTSTPVLIPITFTTFNGLVLMSWPDENIALAAGSYTCYIEKDTDWPAYAVCAGPYDSVRPMYPCGIINAGYQCTGYLRPPITADHTSGNGQITLLNQYVYDDGSNTHIRTSTTSFKTGGGLQSGSCLYRSAIDYSGLPTP